MGNTTLFAQTAMQYPLYRFREDLRQLRESPFTGESDFVASIAKYVRLPTRQKNPRLTASCDSVNRLHLPPDQGRSLVVDRTVSSTVDYEAVC